MTSLASDQSRVPGRLSPNLQTGDFVFRLLPKSFQKDPALDMSFYTEVTPYGHLLRQASPEHPVYYLAQDSGYHQLGGTVDNEVPPPTPEVERALYRALAQNGYLPTTTEHPAGLVVIFVWGAHHHTDDVTDMGKIRNLLERATLVGGKKFAAEVAFHAEYHFWRLGAPAEVNYLNHQAHGELYYVVASAYDYQSLAQGVRQLAWRTTLTVNSRGVALNETLTPLIASGATFFGKETIEPQVGTRPFEREGHVEIGAPTIIEPAQSR